MQIDIKPEDIDNYVKEAILKSSLGETIKKALDKTVIECITSYDSAIKKEINIHISNIVRQFMLEEKNQGMIRAALEKAITPDTINRIVAAGLYELQKQMEEAGSRGII